MIISGANVKPRNIKTNEFVTVMDIAPTVLELASASYPGKHAAQQVQPMLGESMANILFAEGKHVHDSTYATGLEQSGRAYFRKGKWKIVNLEGPHRDITFLLFDIQSDPGETVDLSKQNQAKYREMIEGWRVYRETHGILVAPE